MERNARNGDFIARASVSRSIARCTSAPRRYRFPNPSACITVVIYSLSSSVPSVIKAPVRLSPSDASLRSLVRPFQIVHEPAYLTAAPLAIFLQLLALLRTNIACIMGDIRLRSQLSR